MTYPFQFTLNTDKNVFGIFAQPEGNRLVETESLALMVPEFLGKPQDTVFRSGNSCNGSTRYLSFSSTQVDDMQIKAVIRPEMGAIDLSCSFTTREKLILNRLHLLPGQTKLNLYRCINFRNRHCTDRTWPELLLGNDGCETTTYSDDWQFAPHPTIIGFEKHETRLFIGALDLSHAFGLRFKAHDYRIDHLYLDFGNDENGLPLSAGDTFTSPVFRIFVRHGQDVYGMYREFGQMLINEGRIPDPALKKRESWWREPLYCTWLDQVFEAEAAPPLSLLDQTAETAHPTRVVFSEKMVRDAVEVIKRERLPFKAILLDEGWHLGRGHWEPHPDRFPDLRALVDDLHAEGFKVIVWWNWCEIEAGMEKFIKSEHLIAGGKRNHHGSLMRDYSSKVTQEEYLKPLFYRLFSSDSGCFNLDGVKTDFQADKVHADMPPADPTWRGEENTFYQIYKLFYTEMKLHKPDAVHIGGIANYWLAEYTDINRTYDVFSSNFLEHEQRANMQMATTPGCPIAYDFHYYQENLEGYLQSAARLGASVQIGYLLKTRQDVYSKPVAASPGYYALLRQYLGTREYAPAMTKSDLQLTSKDHELISV